VPAQGLRETPLEIACSIRARLDLSRVASFIGSAA